MLWDFEEFWDTEIYLALNIFLRVEAFYLDKKTYSVVEAESRLNRKSKYFKIQKQPFQLEFSNKIHLSLLQNNSGLNFICHHSKSTYTEIQKQYIPFPINQVDYTSNQVHKPLQSL